MRLIEESQAAAQNSQVYRLMWHKQPQEDNYQSLNDIEKSDATPTQGATVQSNNTILEYSSNTFPEASKQAYRDSS